MIEEGSSRSGSWDLNVLTCPVLLCVRKDAKRGNVLILNLELGIGIWAYQNRTGFECASKLVHVWIGL